MYLVIVAILVAVVTIVIIVVFLVAFPYKECHYFAFMTCHF